MVLLRYRSVPTDSVTMSACLPLSLILSLFLLILSLAGLSLSVLADDPELDQGGSILDRGSELRKAETSGTRGSPVGSMTEALRPRGGSSGSEPSLSRNGAKASREKNLRAASDRTGSLHLDEEEEYDDDFNSHRSDLSNGELSLAEDIEEVSIEGPENSEKSNEATQDLSISQISQSHGADYMEDVS